MRSIVAHSDAVETREVADELIRRCRELLGADRPKGGFLFSSVEYEHPELLSALRREWPDLPLIGGSSDGELSSTLGFCHDSAILTLFAGEDIEVQSGLGRRLSENLDGAVEDAFRELQPALSSLCLSIFAPSTNSSAVIRSLAKRLTASCPIIGGLTGDHREFSKTSEFFGDEVLADSLPLMLLSGDFKFSWGVGSGWMPIGERHTVTRSDGHVVFEIEGRPATDIYEAHYGVVPTSSLGEYPLAVYPAPESDDWCLRAILDSNREDKSLRFAGEITEGMQVRMTEVLPEGILNGSTGSLENALKSYPGGEPQVALVFSCAARKWVLGTAAAKEVDYLQQCARNNGHADLQIAGLYVFGEFSPLNGGSESQFHNETCVSLVIGK